MWGLELDNALLMVGGISGAWPPDCSVALVTSVPSLHPAQLLTGQCSTHQQLVCETN